MICSHCNSYNDENYKFCQYCGKTLVVQHYQSQAQSPYKPETLRKNPQSANETDQVLLGLGLGVATALIVHSMDTKLRTLEDIES